MNRRVMLFKWLFYALTSLLLILLQSTALNHVRILGAHPFLFPALAAMVATLESPREGAVFGLVLGALCDLTLTGPIPCFYAVAFFLIALATVWVSGKLSVSDLPRCVICGALGILLCGLFQTPFVCYRHGAPFAAALRLMGRELAATIWLLPLVYLLFHRISRRMRQD